MEIVSLRQFLNCCHNDFFATRLTHSFSRVVSMAPSTVPVTRDRFWIQTDTDAKIFSHAPEEESRHPQLIAHFNAFTWSDLELPLGGHHFGIGTRYFNPSIKTGSVVSLYYITPVDIVMTDGTVVGTLWTGITLFWPAVGMS